MSSFTIEDATPPIKVSLCDGITKEELLAHKPFKQWLSSLLHNLSTQASNPSHPFHKDPYILKSIQIQSIDRFGGNRIGFLKNQAVIENSKGEWLPGANFMRGGSVAMLVLLEPDDANQSDELYTILTIQPRPAAASLAFAEIPAGMIDDSGTFSGAAAKELQEETGLTFREDELIDMTALTASLIPDESGEKLQRAVYPSPGACDEFIPIFLAKKKVSRKQLEDMQGKLTGLREQGEKITLKIVRARELWKEAFRDGKSLAAWALYSGLRAEGKI